jgi:GDP/UDP-N,N'-diacetylbacillosamine 2-epimerase (hydrolysing)
MTQKLCVITGSRAEYGLLKPLMHIIDADPEYDLQVIATGMHLSPQFGSTYKDIEGDGFRIDRKINILTASDDEIGVAKSVGLGISGFAEAFDQLKPDLIIIVGDRFEILSAAIAALCIRVQIAHVHGGELTTGAIDDAIRHAITKIAHFHFVAAEPYRRRVIQMGEQPARVFNVGGLGVDVISKTPVLDRCALAHRLGINTLMPRNLLVTFHPATLERDSPEIQMKQLLSALEKLVDVGLIFTYANADASGRKINKLIEQFVITHEHSHAFPSLGQQLYLSCMVHFDGVVGNSSSGILEAPVLKKGAINIGRRQNGRLQASSVINCDPTSEQISAALSTLFSAEFQARLPQARSPYGDGGASERILGILKQFKLEKCLEKNFFDISTDFFETE